MNFCFVSTRTFESWDWTNPDRQGIGGSETSHIEMARRLGELGNVIVSFAPIGEAVAARGRLAVGPARIPWYNVEDFPELAAAFPEDWIFILYRCPEVIDLLPEGAIAWLICQDVDYIIPGRVLTPERSKRFTRLVALCGPHAEYLQNRYPDARVSQSSNGIRTAVIEEIEPPAREPHRLMYASSPDRGMEFLLEIFPKVREIVKDAELHIYYGFDNIEKVVAFLGEKSKVGQRTSHLRGLLEQPGVIYHGRTGQRDLLREWFKASLWVHPSNFTETSCITCMEAQACGAIPVTAPIWAIAENVQYGAFIDGNLTHPLIKARYVKTILELLAQPGLQDEIRADMMAWARETFDWDIFAHQWEGWARADIGALSAAKEIEAVA